MGIAGAVARRGAGRRAPGRAAIPIAALQDRSVLGASTGFRSNFPLETTKMMQSLAASHFVTCLTPWGWYSYQPGGSFISGPLSVAAIIVPEMTAMRMSDECMWSPALKPALNL